VLPLPPGDCDWGPIVGVKKLPQILGVLLLVFTAWGLWKVQPWMPANRAVLLGKWKFGNTEFQVWQRKNREIAEPFATGLFVRKGTNVWQSFCINIDDCYSPSIKLREEDNLILISKSFRKFAVFDTTTQTYRRITDRGPHLPMGIGVGNEPPGDWWIKVCSPISFGALP
jgi:hypothetical protein